MVIRIRRWQGALVLMGGIVSACFESGVVLEEVDASNMPSPATEGPGGETNDLAVGGQGGVEPGIGGLGGNEVGPFQPASPCGSDQPGSSSCRVP